MNEKFINYKSDKTYLEREPLEKATKLNQLSAYKHFGFWQCIDTKRDKDRVEKLLKKKKILKKKILILGGTGFIGSALINFFAKTKAHLI